MFNRPMNMYQRADWEVCSQKEDEMECPFCGEITLLIDGEGDCEHCGEFVFFGQEAEGDEE